MAAVGIVLGADRPRPDQRARRASPSTGWTWSTGRPRADRDGPVRRRRDPGQPRTVQITPRDRAARIGSLWPSRGGLTARAGPMARGTVLGFLLGILPGGGAVIASFASYAIEKKLSRDAERFGKGAIEGVAGPEAANNAAAGGALHPAADARHPAQRGDGAAARRLRSSTGVQPGTTADAASARTCSGASSPACTSATSCCWCSTCR